jgi:hypothetical protein
MQSHAVSPPETNAANRTNAKKKSAGAHRACDVNGAIASAATSAHWYRKQQLHFTASLQPSLPQRRAKSALLCSA